MRATPDLVSVIIPVWNRPMMLREAVASAVDQDYQPLEIIVVDDGSTDETPEVIEELGRKVGRDFRASRIDNAGAGAAREAGRQMARGEFIQYLDSDDLLLPGKFSAQVAALRAHPDCGIAYGKTAFQVVGQPPEPSAHKGTGLGRDRLFPALLAERWWSTSTPLYRNSVIEAVGPWLPLSNEEDWEYECRVALQEVSMVWLDEFYSVTRSHSEGHACSGGDTDPAKLADRCVARQHMLDHAVSAGLPVDGPEFRKFLDSGFLLARQAAVQRVAEGERLLEALMGVRMPAKWQMYRALTRVAGSARAAAWYQRLHDLLGRPRGR